MPRILPCALLCAASLSAATPVASMTVPARNPDNGHYYAFFGGAIGFEGALAGAASLSHLGVPGHLATITSQAEQDFVLEYFKNPGTPEFGFSEQRFWIAASDAAVEGEWRWVAGPEQGQLFWQGSVDLRGNITGQSFGYQNWSSWKSILTEPNNSAQDRRRNPEGEDYLALNLTRFPYATQPSFWNDVIGLDDNDRFSPRFGLVEFSVPEPSSGALIASAGSMLVAACRRRAKSAARR